VQILQQTVGRICNHIQDSVNYKQLQEENAELKRKLKAGEVQSSATLAQSATVFGSRVRNISDGTGVTSSLTPTNSVYR